MYNPFPFHDPKAVNRPELSKQTLDSILAGGTPNVVKKFVGSHAERIKKEGLIVAFDGYTTAKWDLFLSLMGRECDLLGLQFETIDAYKATYKSGSEIDAIIDPLLIWDTKVDPTLLYGKVYHGGYKGLMDGAKLDAFINALPSLKAPGKLTAVFGYGCLIKDLRSLYDLRVWFDLTPMNTMLRIRAGEYSNLGKDHTGIINRTIRRCYYCDFENAVQLRKDLFASGELDYCVLDNDRANLQLMPFASFCCLQCPEEEPLEV